MNKFSAFHLALVLLFADFAMGDNFAIVIDTSENMRGDRLTAVRQALMSFVLDASAGTHVTIIGFGSEAKRYSPLVDISSTEKKQRLLASLPNPEDMGGSTSIPSKGIRKALGTFRKAARTYQIVVVITASEETTAPYIKDTKLLSKVDKQKAVVYGIAIGAQATGDDLMALCTQSKGTMFYESETVGEPYTIVEALIRITQDFDRGILHELYMGIFTLPHNERWTQYVTVDPSAGLDTVFYISWMESSSADQNALDFTLVTPSGTTIVPDSREYAYSSAFNMSQYNIPGQAESGKWTMQVVNRMSTTPVSVSALVLSRSVDNKPLWISTRVQVEQTKYPYIWAEVRKGNQHVRGAYVTARVTRPDMPPVDIRLQEHRAGTHNPASDGVYGASFTFFSGDGRYNVQVTAKGSTRKQPRQDEPQTTGEGRRFPVAGSHTGLSVPDDFVRMQTPGMFAATGYSKTDVIAPNTVRDLIVVNRALPCGVVTLKWTAPGDDFTNGRASRYDIRMSTNPVGIRFNFTMQPAVKADEILPESPSSLDDPKESRTEEMLMFRCRICAPRIVVFFSLKAVDDSNNWSNGTHPFSAFGRMSDDTSNCPGTPTSQTESPRSEPVSDELQATPVPGISRVEPIPDDLLNPAPASEVPKCLSESPTATGSPTVTESPLPDELQATPVPGMSRVEPIPDDLLNPAPASEVPKCLSESPTATGLPKVTEPPKSGGTFNQPRPQCNCEKLRIKDHVCQDDITYFGKLVGMVGRADGQQELELDDVTSYTTSVPDGFNITGRVPVIQQCPQCKTMKLKRYYIVSAVLNRSDEVFYIRGNSMIRQLSLKPAKVEDTISRIIRALKKCS